MQKYLVRLFPPLTPLQLLCAIYAWGLPTYVQVCTKQRLCCPDEPDPRPGPNPNPNHLGASTSARYRLEVVRAQSRHTNIAIQYVQV